MVFRVEVGSWDFGEVVIAKVAKVGKKTVKVVLCFWRRGKNWLEERCGSVADMQVRSTGCEASDSTGPNQMELPLQVFTSAIDKHLECWSFFTLC